MREVFSDKESRALFLEGINIAGNTIGSTLGARGKTVIADPGYSNPPMTTKDGVTVAKILSSKNPIKNCGIKMILGVSEATVNAAGDATTTSAVLAQSMINAGMKAVDDGANAQEVKSGIEKGIEAVVNNLKTISTPLTDNETIKSIATVSANNDEEIGKHLADAYAKIGNKGLLTIEPSKTSKTFVTVLEGAEMKSGWSNDKFVNTKKMTVEYENPKILVLNYDIKTLKQIEPFMVQFAKSYDLKTIPLIIIAKSFDGEPHNTFVVNKSQYGAQICLIEATSAYQKEAMVDIATLTGAKLITDEAGKKPEQASVEDLGTCAKIIASRFSTLFIEGKGDKESVDKLKESIKTEIENAKEDAVKEVFENRLARLSGSIGVINVGGLTHVEQTERMHRVDDANRAVKSAIEEGFVAGGGIALIRSSFIDISKMSIVGDEEIGVKIVMAACYAPLKRMLANAGLKGEKEEAVLNGISGSLGNNGYNVKTAQFVDMVEAKIIDPTKVVRCALENAASVACQVINSEALIIEMGE